MRLIGIVLVVFGLIGLVYGGISWTNRETVLDAGPIELTADKKESIPIPPIAGGLAVVAGLALVLKSGS